MIACPSCSHDNFDGSLFCEMCGEDLPASAPDTSGLIACPSCKHLNPRDNLVCEACSADLHLAMTSSHSDSTAAPAQAPEPAPIPDPIDAAAAFLAGDDETEKSSAETTEPNPSAAQAPDSDSEPVASAPNPAQDPAPVLAEPSPSPAALSPGLVKLVVEQGQTVGAQFVLGDDELLVGREDDEEEIYPDIDLSDQDAGFVHRRHALLRFEDGVLTVTHLGGVNKTRVNNKPIADDTPTRLAPGDKIGFGKVVMRLLPA